MNREIKFRGRTHDGKWLYGDLLRVAGGTLIYYGSPVEAETRELEGVGVALMSDEIAAVVPETVGQFTGWRDGGGNEIYEGDIAVAYTYGQGYTGEVIFTEASFGIKTKADGILFAGDFHFIDVLGNVFDNPELLKGGAQ